MEPCAGAYRQFGICTLPVFKLIAFLSDAAILLLRQHNAAHLQCATAPELQLRIAVPQQLQKRRARTVKTQ
jgi:hypothetical protein